MGGSSPYTGRGVVPAHDGHIHGPSKVSPEVVVFCEVHQPGGQNIVQADWVFHMELIFPSFFNRVMEHIPVQEFTQIHIKQESMVLTYPILSTMKNWNELCVVTGHLVIDIQVKL